MSKPKKKLGEILIEDGDLSRQHVKEALDFQKQEGGLIGQVLIRHGFISEEELAAALGKQLNIPYLPPDHYSINLDCAQLLEEAFCRENQICPLDRDEHRFYFVTADPLNEEALEEVRQKTGLKTHMYLALSSEISAMLDFVFQAGKEKPRMKKAG